LDRLRSIAIFPSHQNHEKHVVAKMQRGDIVKVKKTWEDSDWG